MVGEVRMNKNFYCYGFFDAYTQAKAAGNKQQCIQMEHQCYEQFMDVAHKMKWNLIKRLQKTSASAETIYEMTSNYEQDVYPELIKAMNCVKMDAIPKRKNKEGKYTWNFYAAYWGYLSTYNRDVVAHYIKRNTTELSTDFSSGDGQSNVDASDFMKATKASLISDELQSQSPEKTYIEEQEKKAFWKAVDTCVNKRFTSTQAAIWNLKKDATKRLTSKDVCSSLHITPKVYSQEMRAMKDIFNKELAKAQEIF